MKTIAIYARKSVERMDSISIESQIEFCKYEARGGLYQIYSDNGYSGKNTDRPAFHTMMQDVCANRISAVIVYKLDRISRSILDFSEMMELFQKYNVQFISATEKFDTSSPMGRAMLNICIVFAQLERETIQQRVTDAYYSRSKRGFYMGGRIPYGYQKVDTVVDGVHTAKYVAVPEEAEDIKKMYIRYADPGATLGDVVRALQSTSKYNKRGHAWNTARVSDMMRNPVYCMADQSIYRFYQSQKSNIYNAPEDFNGRNGLYLFRGTTNPNRKTWDLAEKEVVVAPHEGIIDAKTWLICRKKLLRNHTTKTGKAKNSWLVGLVKCGRCRYAMSIKKSKRKDGVVRYFCCSLKSASRTCEGAGRTVHADDLEVIISKEIRQKLDTLSITTPKVTVQHNTQRDATETEIQRLNAAIDALLAKLPDANDALMKYINDKVMEYDREKSELERRLIALQQGNVKMPIRQLHNCMDVWDALSLEDKTRVARLLIHKITIYPDRTHIDWNV